MRSSHLAEKSLPPENVSGPGLLFKTNAKRFYLILYTALLFCVFPTIQNNVTAQTVKEKLSTVTAAVNSVASDAKLIFATGDDLSLSGRTSRWIYVFKSESKNRLYEYWYEDGKVVAKSNISHHGDYKPKQGMGYLPDNWKDSHEIISIAESNGGSSFRASHGNNAAIGVFLLPSAFESSGNIPHLYPEAAWEISYRWNDNYFNITINAQTGELITKKEINERKETARQLLTNMDSLAKRLTTDAKIFKVWSPMVDLSGKSGEWIFEYHSIMRHTTFLCTYHFGKIRREPETSPGDHHYSASIEIPDLWMNSDSAIITAELQGGKQFRESHTNTEINMHLDIAESGIPAWKVNYQSPTGGESFQVIAINTENLVNKAQTRLIELKTLAKTYATDAELIFVTTSSISETGDGRWDYLFKSESQQELYQFNSTLYGNIGRSEGITGFFSKEDFLKLDPLPESWLDIQSALIIAENRGGNDFRTNYQDWMINVFLFIPTNENIFNWEINYISENMGKRLQFFLDATAKLTSEEWPKTYGGNQTERGLSILETPDKGFIITGFTFSFGQGNADTWLLKTDKFGNMEWDKTHGGEFNDYGIYIEETDARNYLIAHNTSDSSGVYSGNLLLTDTMGNEKLKRQFSCGSHTEVNSLHQTSDNSYIMAGSCSAMEGESYDFWLIKVSESGDELWSRTYGGAGDDICISMQALPGGGYLLFGTTHSYGAGEADFWLIKTDENGNKTWDKTFGGLLNDEGNSLSVDSDGGFIMTGRTESFGAGGTDIYLVKTDASGNEMWSKTYGTQDEDVSSAVIQTKNRGYIVVGTTDRHGNKDILIVRTDSIGNEIWNNTIGEELTDIGKAICKTSDGNYAITGITRNWGADGVDLFLIKIKDNGGITQLSTLKKPVNIVLSTYPNPFNDFTNIKFDIKQSGNYKIRIVDVGGTEIIVLKNKFFPEGNDEFSWDGLDPYGERVKPGIYFVELKGNNQSRIHKMIIL